MGFAWTCGGGGVGTRLGGADAGTVVTSGEACLADSRAGPERGGSVSTVADATGVVARAMLVASSGATPSVDGNCGLDIVGARTNATPAIPRATSTIETSATGFMAAPCLFINGAM